MSQEQRPRKRSLIHELLVPDWRPTRAQVLWTIRIVIVLVLLLSLLTLVGLPFGITLWDWMKLLVVPLVIAGGGLWFNAQQREREQQIANQRAQDEALQAYLDQMSDLLISNMDRPSLYDKEQPDSLRAVARARTVTALKGLDADHKNSVLDFLRDSQLIGGGKTTHIVSFHKADFRRADLSGTILQGVDLQDANLQEANL